MSDKKKDHPRGSNRFLSEMRRNIIRHAPPSILEEIRPILNQTSAKRDEDNRTNSVIEPVRVSNTRKTKPNVETFEFSVRDHSDATAKRGFRVQVPKRIIFYAALVFFILPIFFLVRVEHRKSQMRKAASRYHSYDVSKVLSHLMSEETKTLPDDAFPSLEKTVHSGKTLDSSTIKITSAISRPTTTTQTGSLVDASSSIAIANTTQVERNGQTPQEVNAKPELNPNIIVVSNSSSGIGGLLPPENITTSNTPFVSKAPPIQQ